LMLAERLYVDGEVFAEGWNFGPNDDDARPVQWIVESMVQSWGDTASWQIDDRSHPHEASYLKLDISKAKARLAWQPRWSLATALEKITDWHHDWLGKADMKAKCLQQISDYQRTTI
jgi:CDP-glucose 4,6-dehydratase